MMDALKSHVDVAVERAWPQLLALIARAAAILHVSEGIAPTLVTRTARKAALRLIRPAEALVRRLIFTLAARYHTTPLPPGPHLPPEDKPGPAPRTAAPITTSGPRTPNFRLFEHVASLASIIGPPRAETFGPPKPPTKLCSPARLIARIDALKHAIETHADLAARYARAVPRAIAERWCARVDPLRRGHPPGAASRHTEPWLADSLYLLTMWIRRIDPPLRPEPPPLPA